MAALTRTLVPGSQYFFGRQTTQLSLNQWKPPSVFLLVVIFSARSAALRFGTGAENWNEIGMPTPTVCPSGTDIVTLICPLGWTVVNVERSTVFSPSSPTPRAVSLYCLP